MNIHPSPSEILIRYMYAGRQNDRLEYVATVGDVDFWIYSGDRLHPTKDPLAILVKPDEVWDFWPLRKDQYTEVISRCDPEPSYSRRDTPPPEWEDFKYIFELMR